VEGGLDAHSMDSQVAQHAGRSVARLCLSSASRKHETISENEDGSYLGQWLVRGPAGLVVSDPTALRRLKTTMEPKNIERSYRELRFPDNQLGGS
jgi:hypothetical protein